MGGSRIDREKGSICAYDAGVECPMGGELAAALWNAKTNFFCGKESTI